MIGFLTILGYSLYDTVVVFDKVRENTAEAFANGAAHLRAGRQPRGQPDPGPVDQHDRRRRCCRSPRSSSSASAPRPGHPARPRARALRRHRRRRLLVDLHRHAAAGRPAPSDEPVVRSSTRRRCATRPARQGAAAEAPRCRTTRLGRAGGRSARTRPSTGHRGALTLTGAGRLVARGPQVGQQRPAQPAAAHAQVEALTAMSGRGRPSTRAASRQPDLRDIPDFPQPGVVFKDITPLLADGDGVRGGRRGHRRPVRAAGRRRRGIEARGFILGAAVAHAPRHRVRPGAQGGQAARPTRCASRTTLEYGTRRPRGARGARSPPGAAGAGRRRRPRHRWHRRRDLRSSSSGPVPTVVGIDVRPRARPSSAAATRSATARWTPSRRSEPTPIGTGRSSDPDDRDDRAAGTCGRPTRLSS